MDANQNQEYSLGHQRGSDSSSSDGDDECKIVPGPIDDDYLETLDRKVYEIMNRDRTRNLPGSRSSADLSRSNSEKYGPLSMGYSQRRRASNQQLPGGPPSADMNAPSSIVGEEVVRFDDEDGGGESTDSRDSSPEDLGGIHWSDDPDDSEDELDNPRFMLRRRSTIRRPIRSKNRHSVMSMQSVSTISSEEGNTTEIPYPNNDPSKKLRSFSLPAGVTPARLSSQLAQSNPQTPSRQIERKPESGEDTSSSSSDEDDGETTATERSNITIKNNSNPASLTLIPE